MGLRQLRDWRSDRVSLMGRTVFVPDGVRVSFPDRCVACGATRPEGSVQFSSARLLKYWHRWFWNYTPARWLWPFGRSSVSVPCCPACAARLVRCEWVRIWAYTACLVLTLASFALSVVEFRRWHLGDRNRFKMAALIMLAPMLTAFAIDTMLPAPFVFWKDWLGLHYRFSSVDAAQEFYELNRAAESPFQRLQ